MITPEEVSALRSILRDRGITVAQCSDDQLVQWKLNRSGMRAAWILDNAKKRNSWLSAIRIAV